MQFKMVALNRNLFVVLKTFEVNNGPDDIKFLSFWISGFSHNNFCKRAHCYTTLRGLNPPYSNSNYILWILSCEWWPIHFWYRILQWPSVQFIKKFIESESGRLVNIFLFFGFTFFFPSMTIKYFLLLIFFPIGVPSDRVYIAIYLVRKMKIIIFFFVGFSFFH